MSHHMGLQNLQQAKGGAWTHLTLTQHLRHSEEVALSNKEAAEFIINSENGL